jgi:hypothetical protein
MRWNCRSDDEAAVEKVYDEGWERRLVYSNLRQRFGGNRTIGWGESRCLGSELDRNDLKSLKI